MAAKKQSKKPNAYVEALLKVRNVLTGKPDNSVYICLELGDVYEATQPDNLRSVQIGIAASRILADIKKAMGGYRDTSVEVWLSGKGFKPYIESREVRRDYRIRWIDAMIEQYKDFPEPLCK